MGTRSLRLWETVSLLAFLGAIKPGQLTQVLGLLVTCEFHNFKVVFFISLVLIALFAI